MTYKQVMKDIRTTGKAKVMAHGIYNYDLQEGHNDIEVSENGRYLYSLDKYEFMDWLQDIFEGV